MACSGHTSAHARHLLQSLSVVSPAATSCRLMPSGHACSHRLQALPRPSRRHFSASIWGRNVRFSPLNSESSAPRGQKRWHHFGSSRTSNAMMTGKATTVHVASPNANRRMTSSTVANVRPIGQTRQNTGKPKTSVEPNAAARMPWRLSILMPLDLPQGEAHVEQGCGELRWGPPPAPGAPCLAHAGRGARKHHYVTLSRRPQAHGRGAGGMKEGRPDAAPPATTAPAT